MQDTGALVVLKKESRDFAVRISETVVKKIASLYAGPFNRFGIGDYDEQMMTVIPFPESGEIAVTGLSPGQTGVVMAICVCYLKCVKGGAS